MRMGIRALYRQLARDTPDMFNPELAQALEAFIACLQGHDHREEALKYARESVTLYRSLARDKPGDFNTQLAAVLENLGTRLSTLGFDEEAPEVVRESVTIYRSLASALEDLATRLSKLGRDEEAGHASRERAALDYDQTNERLTKMGTAFVNPTNPPGEVVVKVVSEAAELKGMHAVGKSD